MIAELADDAPLGAFQRELLIQTNDRRLTTFPIRVAANVTSALQVSPPKFALGDVHTGDAVNQRLVIKGTKPFKILDIQSGIADIQYEASEDAKLVHIVNLILEPTRSLNQEINDYITVKTDFDDRELKLDLSFRMIDGVNASPVITPGPSASTIQIN